MRRPARAGPGPRALTQAELLAEAARTEIENLRSLAALEAAAAEVRAAADVQRTRYVGPMLRWASRRVGDTEQVTQRGCGVGGEGGWGGSAELICSQTTLCT